MSLLESSLLCLAYGPSGELHGCAMKTTRPKQAAGVFIRYDKLLANFIQYASEERCIYTRYHSRVIYSRSFVIFNEEKTCPDWRRIDQIYAFSFTFIFLSSSSSFTFLGTNKENFFFFPLLYFNKRVKLLITLYNVNLYL